MINQKMDYLYLNNYEVKEYFGMENKYSPELPPTLQWSGNF